MSAAKPDDLSIHVVGNCPLTFTHGPWHVFASTDAV